MKNKKGFTLIELLLAILISVILIIAVFYLYSKVSNNNKTNKIINEIHYVRSEYDQFFQYTLSDQSYDPTTNVKSNFPVINDNQHQKEYRSPFGGKLLYYHGVNDAGASLTIYLQEKGLSADSCVKIAISQIGYAEEINSRGGSINNVKDLSVNEVISKMIKNCSTMEKYDSQYLYFVYR